MTMLQIAAMAVFSLLGVVAITGLYQAAKPFLPALPRFRSARRPAWRTRSMIVA